MRRLVAALLGGILLVGCNHARRQVPAANPPWAQADYAVVGHTSHEECGTYIFFVDWARLFSNQRTVIAGRGLWLSGLNREESRALYFALEKLPEATHLLEHRARTTITGLAIGTQPIFGERCVAVDARGVRIGDRPAVYVLQGQGTGPAGAPPTGADPRGELVPPMPLR